MRALLLVSLDNRGWPDRRAIRILAEFTAGSPLSQEVPALIELNLNVLKTNLVVIR